MPKKTSLILVFLVFFISVAHAADPSPWTKETTYGSKTWSKFKYGLSNLGFGWTEILSRPFDSIQSGSVYDMVMGLPYGLWNGLGDTLGGAAHMLTAPIPSIDIPLPDGGIDMSELKEEK